MGPSDLSSLSRVFIRLITGVFTALALSSRAAFALFSGSVAFGSSRVREALMLVLSLGSVMVITGAATAIIHSAWRT